MLLPMVVNEPTSAAPMWYYTCINTHVCKYRHPLLILCSSVAQVYYSHKTSAPLILNSRLYTTTTAQTWEAMQQHMDIMSCCTSPNYTLTKIPCLSVVMCYLTWYSRSNLLSLFSCMFLTCSEKYSISTGWSLSASKSSGEATRERERERENNIK